jgi:hypothetical protein
MVMSFELGALHLLGRCAATSAMPLAVLSYFLNRGSNFCLGLVLDPNLPIYASHTAGMSSVAPPCSAYWLR